MGDKYINYNDLLELYDYFRNDFKLIYINLKLKENNYELDKTKIQLDNEIPKKMKKAPGK
jgi:hypothetical protein